MKLKVLDNRNVSQSFQRPAKQARPIFNTRFSFAEIVDRVISRTTITFTSRVDTVEISSNDTGPEVCSVDASLPFAVPHYCRWRWNASTVGTIAQLTRQCKPAAPTKARRSSIHALIAKRRRSTTLDRVFVILSLRQMKPFYLSENTGLFCSCAL